MQLNSSYNLPSIMKLRELGSRITEAVRPAAEDPLPDVYTAIGATLSTNFNSCDLAVPGSPSSKMLMSPLRVKPSGNLFLDPPNSRQAIAFLMSLKPQMDGAMDLEIKS